MVGAMLGAVTVALFAVSQAILGIFSVYHHAANLNASLFVRDADSTTYVSTGDIDAMWLRDSSVQAMSAMHNRVLVRGVIARQERLIAIDPYANAFYRNYQVAERKFEIDSLCYPVRLLEKYAKDTRDRSIFDSNAYGMLHKVLITLAVERHHATESQYRRNEHPVASNIGLIWSAYRPSDDPQAYNYNVPENIFAAVTLREMARMFSVYYQDGPDARRAANIADDIVSAIAKRAIFRTTFGRMYAYEIDGLGHAKFMDDANVPSLLSIPLLNFPYDRQAYADTRRFIFSPANPYYFVGRYASGVGSSHTPTGYVWPMSLVIEYQTATSTAERKHVLRELGRSDSGDGTLHESFDPNDPRRFTRPRFGWVNALFDLSVTAR